MDEMIQISQEEYASLAEEAKKVLETIPAEYIPVFRKICLREIWKVISFLENRGKQYRKRIPEVEKALAKELQGPNPFDHAIRRFWLVQLFNFILSLLGFSREFTPTVGYPHGASKASRNYDEYAKQFYGSVIDAGKEGVEFTGKSQEYFSDLKKKIEEDDVKLILFIIVCSNITSLKADLKVQTDDLYKETVVLLYQNNVPFSSRLYLSDFRIKEMAALVSSMIETSKLEKLQVEAETVKNLRLQAEQETEKQTRQLKEKKSGLQKAPVNTAELSGAGIEPFIDNLLSARSMQEIQQAWDKAELKGKTNINLEAYIAMRLNQEISDGPLQNLEAVKQAIIKILEKDLST